MRNRFYSDEAERCRDLAAEIGDASERPFLLRIAEAFDDLAGRKPHGQDHVIGPLGELLTLEKLPATNTRRWTPRRKAEVIAAVAGGLLSVDEACQRYSLSIEEFTSWQGAAQRSGMPGLRVTKVQHYRELYKGRRTY